VQDNDFTKILGWPGYRVFQHEINEGARALRLWVRRIRRSRPLICSGCGKRVRDVVDASERLDVVIAFRERQRHCRGERKAADVIGLYLNPPQHAAVFCVDEKTAIQALDRLDPVLPLSPGRAERHGFEYYRHGTLSLYAALDTKTGRVHGKTTARHTSADFVDFLGEIIAHCRPKQEIHIILDNLSAHKTQAVRDFLDAHPQVRLHFTPTYSSWLNQVEIWFAKIERDVIARGVFTSVPDLARKLRRYINAYSANAQPIRWKYSDVTHRIRSNDLVATSH